MRLFNANTIDVIVWDQIGNRGMKLAVDDIRNYSTLGPNGFVVVTFSKKELRVDQQSFIN